MLRFLLSIGFLVLLVQSAGTAPKIAATKTSNGVEFSPTGLLDTDTDDTYKAFSKVKNGKFGRYDFYYSLEIVPQFKEKYASCSSNPNFETYFNALFGISQAALVVVKTDVQYRWTTGVAVDFLKNDAGLVLAATGTSPTTAQPGNGCFFDQTLRPTFPLLQYGGAGADQNYDDFVIKFISVGGKSKNYNAVQTAASLFSKISAFAGWTAVTGALASGAAQSFDSAAQSFQSALQAAGTSQNQTSISYTLKANGGPDEGRIAITIPELFGGSANNGNMAMFVRRQASIALSNDDTVITPDMVFDNQELPNRQCNPTTIAGGTCNTNNDTIRTALAKLLKSVDSGLGDGTNPVVQLFDLNVPSREKVVYQMCKALRTVSRLNLHLSTVDEMMIRWAFAKEGGVIDALADSTKASALAQANGVSTTDLANMCWNQGDQQTLTAMAASLHKALP